MLSTFPGAEVVVPLYFSDSRGVARDLVGPTEWFRWRVMANEAGAYTQVYPPVGWVAGDLSLDREGLGEYAVRFTVGPAWVVGQYLLEVEATGARAYRWEIRFEVVASELPALRNGDHLALVRDMRELGIAPAVANYKIAQALVRASRQVERYCGRIFTPRKMTQRLYVETSGRLWFPSPCVWLQSITAAVDGTVIDLGSANFFSRAVRVPPGAPSYGEDDRDASRVEVGGLARGRAYDVTGVFGYTEPDGSDIGKTPEQLVWAVTATTQTFLSYQSSGPAPVPVDRIIEEKTATQSYKLSDNYDWAQEVTAGDTEIARVLNGFRRPMQIGFV